MMWVGFPWEQTWKTGERKWIRQWSTVEGLKAKKGSQRKSRKKMMLCAEQSREILILEEKKKKKKKNRTKTKRKRKECEWVSKKEKNWLVFKAREEWFLFFLFLSLSLTIPMPYPFVQDRFCCGRAGLEVWHKEYISLIVYLVTYRGLDKFVCDFVGTFCKDYGHLNLYNMSCLLRKS